MASIQPPLSFLNAYESLLGLWRAPSSSPWGTRKVGPRHHLYCQCRSVTACPTMTRFHSGDRVRPSLCCGEQLRSRATEDPMSSSGSIDTLLWLRRQPRARLTFDQGTGLLYCQCLYTTASGTTTRFQFSKRSCRGTNKLLRRTAEELVGVSMAAAKWHTEIAGRS